MTKNLELLLVDDHVLFRKGVASLFAARPGMTVIGEANDGHEALEMAREALPDVILMDVHMPRCDGLVAVRSIKRELPTIKIIMLTVDEKDEMLFEAIKSGAQGYVLKKLEPQVLFDMVETVARGEVALSPTMMSKILAEYQKPVSSAVATDAVREELSRREMDVLEEIVKGMTNQEIAQALNITENTVKKHLQSILSKLHLHNRIQAAVYAVEEGLVSRTKTAE